MTTKPDPDALADELEELEEVLADVIELLRGYVAHHRKRAYDATTVNAAVDSSMKAERNCAMAWRVERQLAALRARSPEAGRAGEDDALRSSEQAEHPGVTALKEWFPEQASRLTDAQWLSKDDAECELRNAIDNAFGRPGDDKPILAELKKQGVWLARFEALSSIQGGQQS